MKTNSLTWRSRCQRLRGGLLGYVILAAIGMGGPSWDRSRQVSCRPLFLLVAMALVAGVA